MAKKRAIVYVDGFNLYYGAIKGSSDKWLNLEKYFRCVRQADDVEQVYFFTAMVDGASLQNQQTYLQALATTPSVRIVLGKFKFKDVDCRVSGCCHGGAKRFRVKTEKRTDVNIALQLFEDAMEDRADVLVIVSGDSDLVPAVHRVRNRFPSKRVVVYVPARDPDRSAAVELRTAAHSHRDLPLNILKLCQFPPTLPDGSGGVIMKPPSW